MAELKYLHVKNWRKHQHYKFRNPPWIKLHEDILMDHDFTCLQDASKLHLICIWVLARVRDGVIPNDPRWVKKFSGLDSEIDLTPLIERGFLIPSDLDSIPGQDASTSLATCPPEVRLGKDSKEEVGGRESPARPPAFPAESEPLREVVAEVVKSYQVRRYRVPDPTAKYLPVLTQEVVEVFETQPNPHEALKLFQARCRGPDLPQDASFSDIAIACGLKKPRKAKRDPPKAIYKDYTAERLAGQLGVAE